MWSEGTVDGYTYSVKHYDIGSEIESTEAVSAS